MNITEARKLIASMMAIYQSYNPEDPKGLTAKMWADFMPDYSYEQANTALACYVRLNTSGFAPTPGQLIDIIHTMTTPQELNEMEAWALVRQAIGRSTYYSMEEFSKLPPSVQKAIGDSGQLRIWAMDEDFSESVVMANFQRAYRTVINREKEISKMPDVVRELIEKNRENSPSKILEQKRRIKTEQGVLRISEENCEGIPMPEKYRRFLRS